MNQVKQKVYIILQYPVQPDHSEECRIIDVFATKVGAAKRIIRLRKQDDHSTYHLIEKSVNGTTLFASVGSSTMSRDYVIIHDGFNLTGKLRG
jgi:hypothetical protein